jgi:ABC-type xylose transport system permease subunit
VLICLALGAAIGGMQGYFTAYYKIPAFIVTLAGMLIFKGLALSVLGGASVGPFPKNSSCSRPALSRMFSTAQWAVSHSIFWLW